MHEYNAEPREMRRHYYYKELMREKWNDHDVLWMLNFYLADGQQLVLTVDNCGPECIVVEGLTVKHGGAICEFPRVRMTPDEVCAFADGDATKLQPDAVELGLALAVDDVAIFTAALLAAGMFAAAWIV